jgi:hypothetical protein
LIFVQASGRDEMQVPLRAFCKQVTIVRPTDVIEMPEVPKQVATLPTAKGPRAATQSGMSTKSNRPLTLLISWQGLGRVVTQIEAVAVATTVLKQLVAGDDAVGVITEAVRMLLLDAGPDEAALEVGVATSG